MRQLDYIKTLIFAFKATNNFGYLRQARDLLDEYNKELETNRQYLLAA